MRYPGLIALASSLLLLACGDDATEQPTDTHVDPGDTQAGVDVADTDAPADDAATSQDTTSDAAATDTAPGVIEPGEFGAPCVENIDCNSGWCVESDQGPVCTRICTQDCPSGWTCLGVTGQVDVTFLCVPRQDRLCQPCAVDGQCHTGYCTTLAEGRRCTGRCETVEDCPPGYACDLITSEDTGESSTQCVPANGACDCVPGKEGFLESCSVANDEGTCFGVRTCLGAPGWGPCDAQVPTAEVCDGVDNNCNRLVDENLGGESCDVTNAFGTCPGTRVCEGATGYTCVGRAAAPETCNYVDDDCDGQTDEAFPDVGLVCAAGDGVCARFGVSVCTADGAATTCTATAGAPAEEICNLIDDDCDGVTDNGFVDAQGRYFRDDACGNCFTDCTTIFDRPNAFGACDALPSLPVCRMICEPGYFDLNAVPDDGCELLLDPTAIHVGKDSPGAAGGACGLGPLGTGDGHFPCQTIAQGLSRAAATGRTRVLVADGLYPEQVTVASGVSLYGGYRADTWERHLASTGTIIRGPDGAGDRKTLVAINITQPTVIEGFVINAANAVTTGANSYAVYVRNSTGALTFRDNLVFAGLGGPGSTGAAGASGGNGQGGTAGQPTKNIGACTTTPNNPGGGGGVRSCPNPANPSQFTNVSGGKGGDSVCPAQGVQEGFGASGLNGGGAGGAGGWGHNSSTTGCSPTSGVPEVGVDGADAVVNPNVADGAGGSGCTNALGVITSDEWRGVAGGVAGHGQQGRGGGGGGAGSGGRLSSSNHDISGSGGGGGSGGCAGSRGSGGAAGGGSFGVFLLWTTGNKPTSSAGVPAVTGNVINRNQGGPGGSGGNGGAGGDPGPGAAGGALVISGLDSPAFCVFGGAKGGFGSRGGHGGGGGGACGGASYDILAWGINNQSHGFASNTFPTGGATTGGVGGAGGNSSNTTKGGAPGGTGNSGTVRVVN